MAILFAIAVFVILFVIKKFVFGDQRANNKLRPGAEQKPVAQEENDKIIIINNINRADIESALMKFCDLYNKNNWAALPRLTQIHPASYAVTFPYDIDFVTFCFAVNFLKYPPDIRATPDVKAWATTNQSDKWITEKSVNKKVMLYLADDDKEYDNVFLTTADNIGYKLGLL